MSFAVEVQKKACGPDGVLEAFACGREGWSLAGESDEFLECFDLGGLIGRPFPLLQPVSSCVDKRVVSFEGLPLTASDPSS